MKRIVAGACLLLLLAFTSAHAERRVALVVGNSAYGNVASLPNASNDADAVAKALRGARFDVVELRPNLGIRELRRAVGDFADAAANADIALVYYAGHGIEIDGTNYLIPVDAKLARDFDVEDEALALDRVVRAIEPARQLRLVILDACRDNPFAKTMKRAVGTRSLGRGLAKVEPTADTLIAYSAKAGSVALDGDTRNSPFTTALVKHLPTPGLDIRIAFGRVRDDVLETTKRQQEPFIYGSLGGRTVTLVEAPPEPRSAASSAASTADLRAGLDRVLRMGLTRPDNERLRKLIDAYEARKGAKVMTMAPSNNTWWRTSFLDDARAAEETLEGCQVAYGQPCVVVAVGDKLVADDSGNWHLVDTARARYSGAFDPERIPVIGRAMVSDSVVAQYRAAKGPKAAVFRPAGWMYFDWTGGSARETQERAFAKCRADPRRLTGDTCLLYAVDDQVVLTRRQTEPSAP